MKKLLLIATLLVAASCAHHDQKISLNISLKEDKADIGKGAALDLMVFDDRKDYSVIGRKEFSHNDKVNITSRQDLALLLTQKIEQNLIDRGFSKGSGKVVEIHIEQLFYLAKRGFPVGTSEGNADIKVVVKDPKSSLVVTKNFNLSINNKHFIAPLESTDAATINDMLQEISQDILDNQDLMQTLAK